MIGVTQLRSFVAEGLEAIRAAGGAAEIFAARNEPLIARLNYTSEIPCNGVQEPKSSPAYGVSVLATFRDEGELRVGCGGESDDLSTAGLRRVLEKARRHAVYDADFKTIPSPSGEQPTLEQHHDPQVINGLGPGDFTCTLVGDSYRIEHGTLGQPLQPNTVRINDNFLNLFQQIIGSHGIKSPRSSGWQRQLWWHRHWLCSGCMSRTSPSIWDENRWCVERCRAAVCHTPRPAKVARASVDDGAESGLQPY
jgi:hypothetical protein